jgi:hypothetical protein
VLLCLDLDMDSPAGRIFTGWSTWTATYSAELGFEELALGTYVLFWC